MVRCAHDQRKCYFFARNDHLVRTFFESDEKCAGPAHVADIGLNRSRKGPDLAGEGRNDFLETKSRTKSYALLIYLWTVFGRLLPRSSPIQSAHFPHKLCVRWALQAGRQQRKKPRDSESMRKTSWVCLSLIPATVSGLRLTKEVQVSHRVNTFRLND